MGLLKLINNRISSEWKDIFNKNVDYMNDLETKLTDTTKVTNNRIDNLVLSSGGDSPNEVVDARVNNKGETFSTLQERLSTVESQNEALISQLTTLLNNANDEINQLNKTISALYAGSGAEVSIYVSTEKGSDTTGDGTENNPFKTIQSAVNSIPLLSSMGTTIFIDNGVYKEDVQLVGNISPRITFRTLQPVTADDAYNQKLPVKIRSFSSLNCNANIRVYGIQFVDQANTAVSRFPFSVEIREGGMLLVQRCSFGENTKAIDSHTSVYVGDNSNAHVMESYFTNQNTAFFADTSSDLRIGGKNKGSGNNTVCCAENATIRFMEGVSGTTTNKTVAQGLIITKGTVL